MVIFGCGEGMVLFAVKSDRGKAKAALGISAGG
jgi:hypothetical protein